MTRAIRIQLKSPDHPTTRIFKSISRCLGSLYKWVETSKVTIGLIGGVATTIIIGRRDAYIRRDEIFRPQRAALIAECSAFIDQIEGPLIRSTYGYIDYGVDIENINGPGLQNRSPVLPPEHIPADKEEAVKWKIRKEQAALFTEIAASGDQRKKILRLIQNYTIDPKIEVEWRLIDTALNLLPDEDRFVSTLWMRRERLKSGASSMIQWNMHNETSGAKEQEQFIEHSSMAFRIYFYQQFIRDHAQQLLRLILREQAGNSSVIPNWLWPLPERPIPAISYSKTIDIIYQEHEQFRATYRKRANDVDAMVSW